MSDPATATAIGWKTTAALKGVKWAWDHQDVPAKPAKAERAKKPKAMPAKIDAKYLKAARELRDRWMEHVNAGGLSLDGAGKYDVVRAIADDATPLVMKQLPLAA